MFEGFLQTKIEIKQPAEIKEPVKLISTQVLEDEIPVNDSTLVPPGFSEDVKKFSVENVDAWPVSKQLTDILTANYYVIKEIRFYFSGIVHADAYFHVNAQAMDGTGATAQTVYGSVRYFYK